MDTQVIRRGRIQDSDWVIQDLRVTGSGLVWREQRREQRMKDCIILAYPSLTLAVFGSHQCFILVAPGFRKEIWRPPPFLPPSSGS
jgi:hypothetical protein